MHRRQRNCVRERNWSRAAYWEARDVRPRTVTGYSTVGHGQRRVSEKCTYDFSPMPSHPSLMWSVHRPIARSPHSVDGHRNDRHGVGQGAQATTGSRHDKRGGGAFPLMGSGARRPRGRQAEDSLPRGLAITASARSEAPAARSAPVWPDGVRFAPCADRFATTTSYSLSR
jgi:hypothetical protein